MLTPEEIIEWMEFDARFFLENACEYINYGASRCVWRVKYTHYVVKADRCFHRNCFGANNEENASCKHPTENLNGNNSEWDYYKKILAKFPNFKRFVTELYAISSDGRYLVAEFLPLEIPRRMLDWKGTKNSKRRHSNYSYSRLNPLFHRLLHSNGIRLSVEDIHARNFGRRAGSKIPVLLDLGHGTY